MRQKLRYIWGKDIMFVQKLNGEEKWLFIRKNIHFLFPRKLGLDVTFRYVCHIHSLKANMVNILECYGYSVYLIYW